MFNFQIGQIVYRTDSRAPNSSNPGRAGKNTIMNKGTTAMWIDRINLKDIFHNEALSFEERRDAIVKRICKSSWFTLKEEYDDLHGYIEELSETSTASDFDDVWSAIYDLADADRVWIGTV